MKRVSEGEEPAIVISPVLADVEVQVPLVAVPVEVRTVRVAAVLPDGIRTKYHPCHCSLNAR